MYFEQNENTIQMVESSVVYKFPQLCRMMNILPVMNRFSDKLFCVISQITFMNTK